MVLFMESSGRSWSHNTSRLKTQHALVSSAPQRRRPWAAFVAASQAGSLIFLSGMLPLGNSKLSVTGRLGENLSVEQGREAVRIAALNAWAVALQHRDDLDRIQKLTKLSVVLATTEQFAEHAAVADGASDLFVQLFGTENGHARIGPGVLSLPIGTPSWWTSSLRSSNVTRGA